MFLVYFAQVVGAGGDASDKRPHPPIKLSLQINPQVGSGPGLISPPGAVQSEYLSSEL